MAGWKPKAQTKQWNWRDYLTKDEAKALQAADAAKAEWQRLNVERRQIMTRAIQRARYDALQR